MSVESLLAALGLSEVLAGGVTAVEFGLVVGSVLAFAGSLALMILAGRAAGSARASKREAESILRSAQDLVVEARQLSSRMERAHASGPSDDRPRAPVRVSARETTPEAEVEVLDLAERDVAGRNLSAAKDGSTVPQMKKGYRRRRR